MRTRNLAIWTAVLSCLATIHEADASGQSAAALYDRAFNTLQHASRFDIVTATTLLVPGGHQTYRDEVRFIAPHHFLSSMDLGFPLGVSWQVQVNGSSCYWNVGPNFRRIFCAHASWQPSLISQIVHTQSLPSGLNHAHFALGRRIGATQQITVSGLATSPCRPGCPAVFPKVPLHGVLTIDARRLLPLTFTAAIAGRAGPQQTRISIRYRYDPHFTIRLPTGARIPCPYYAPPHGWCLAQH